MNDPRLIYFPREDATPESERTTLVTVYAFVLEHHERKEADTAVGDDEDGTEAGHAGGPPKECPDDERSSA